MKSTNVKKTLFSIIFCLTVLVSLKAQEVTYNTGKEMFLDELPDIKIEKLIFYQNPIFIEYKKITDDYIPEWYAAYCANGYFDYFKDYPQEAVKYFHSISGITIEQLTKHLENVRANNLSLEVSNPNPYEYVYGEIWFCCKKTNERIGIVMGYLPSSKINNFSFGNIVPNASEEYLNTPFKNMANFQRPFIYEDNLLKLADLNYVFEERLDGKNVVWKGTTFESFSVLLKNAPTYIRSRLINGKRIFETVKNTPNGPVVVE